MTGDAEYRKWAQARRHTIEEMHKVLGARDGRAALQILGDFLEIEGRIAALKLKAWEDVDRCKQTAIS